jgi:uncharacterized protein YihD (DUF1040 family)
MMAYMLRSGVKDKVKFASDIAKPVDKFEVQQIKLFNEFNRRNPRTKKADGGMLVKPSADGSRPGYAKISKISKDLKQTPTRTDISVEKQKVVDDVLEQLVKRGNTTFEKVSEVIDQIVKKGMGRTTARTGIENSKFLSQFKFLGKGATLDQEILESDWFKRNYPNATTLEEALTVPRTVGKGTITRPMTVLRKEYKLAKERGFPLSQKELADELGIPKQTLRDYISYAQTSAKPTDPKEISRIKRAKEFFKLLKDSGITFTGGGQRYGSAPLRFTAKPEQIANLKKSYEEDFLQAFTKEQKKLLDDTVRSTYDDMIKSGNLMKKFEFAKLLNTKLGFGSVNAMTRAIDRVLSKKEIDVLPKAEFVSGGEREIKKRKSIEMAGDDANQIRKSQNRFLDVMKSEFKKLSDKDLLKLIKNTPQLLNQVTLRFDKKTGEFFNQNIDDLDANTIRMRSQPNVEHIKKIKEAGIQAEWPYNRQVAVRNINGHIKESVESFINEKEPLLRRKDIPIETKQKIKNQILNIENKMNEMNLRMFANNKYRGVPEGLPAIDRKTGQLTSFFENVKSMGLKPETYSVKIPSKFKPIAVAAGLTGGLITAAAAGTESPEQASNLLDNAKLAGAGTAGALAVGTKPGRQLLGKAFRTLGTPLAGTALAANQIRSNIQSGENVADAVVDPLVGLELSFPGLFKENLKKITSSPTAQRILSLGKFGRALTPIGAGITAAGLGIDAAKFTKKRIDELRSMTPEQRTELRSRGARQAFDPFSAAGGGIAKQAGDRSGAMLESMNPDKDGLPGLLKRVKKL